MKVIVCENYAELSEKAYAVMKEVVTSKPDAVLGLATGSSPEGLYVEMVNDYKERNTSYENVKTFNLDEYVGIDRDHEQSYFTFMNEHLFKHINIKKENTHLPFGNTQEDCNTYEQLMSDYELDIQVLGIGSNGHIGFNEPGTSFDALTHIVDLQENTIADNARFFDGNIDLVPKKAISMGIASIMKSKKILLLASGESKADAVYGLVKGAVTTDCPASVLQNHPDVIVVIDKAAASKL